MKNFIKKILKKINLYWHIRKIYQFFFLKGYIYQKFQRLFANISIRIKMASIERKIIKLIFFRSQKYFKLNIDQNNKHYTQLYEQGCTTPFTLESIENNKKAFLEYFKNKKIFNDKFPDKKFYLNEKPEDLEVGYFDNSITANCPYIFDVINDPLIIKSLSTYFGCPYKLDYITAWWSFKNKLTESKEKTQYFHRDIDNFNFIKLFLYLTDVDELSGPHQYIKFTHKKDFGFKLSTKVVDINTLHKNIDNDIHTFSGKSGSVVLENTLGLHRAKKPEVSDRLMIAMSFSLINTPYCPPKPFLKFQNLQTNLSQYNKHINQNFII